MSSGGADLTVAAIVFAVATVVLTLPLPLSPASLSRLDNGDARLNAWAISWVAHQIVHDPLRLFDANTFYPLPRSLAYSEHLTLEGVLALPLLAVTDDLVLTTNVLLLASIWASALGMYLLARRLTGSHLAALLAGLFFSFAPFRFNRLPHIQVQLYAFLPLVLWGLHRFLDTRRSRFLALMALFFILQALAGTYLGAITAVALGVALVTLLPFARLTRGELGRVALALGGAALALLPFALPYLWVNRELGIEWDLEGVGSLAATPSSYLASSSHLYRGLSDYLVGAGVTDYLFPGLTLLVLGSVGMVLLARDGERRPLLVCYGSILVAGVVLSLGPVTPVHAFLYEHIVFFRGLRALTRFGLLPLFALSTLSAFALAWLLEAKGGPSRPKLAATAVALFFVAESTALPYGLVHFEDDPPEVYSWLASAKPGPIVELPFKVIDTRYMFWARHHGFRPMLNGDSGFVPMSHQWMKNALGRFPSDDAVELLRRLEVRYVVLHLGAFRKPALLRLLQELERQRGALLPVRDFGRDIVFEVIGSGDPRREREEEPPDVALAVVGSRPALFDGDTGSVTRAEGPTLEVDVELREPAAIEAVRIHYGAAPRVPAGRVEVFLDDSPVAVWSTPPRWPAVTELVSGLLATPRDGTQTLRLPAISGRKLRFRLKGLDGEPIELTEMTLLGRPAGGASPLPAEDGETEDGLEPEAAIEREGGVIAAADHQR